MEEAKIQFSPTEMELMCNSSILLTKNNVLLKLRKMLEGIQQEMLIQSQEYFHLNNKEIFSFHPKISRGENYLGLPYLILDFPRCFQNENIFTLRTMFWWGNFFSTTLHLSGSYKINHEANIATSFLSLHDYSIGINEDPWIHHFEKDNYKEISLLNKESFQLEVERRKHLKIAKKYLLDDSGVGRKLVESWKELTEICLH